MRCTRTCPILSNITWNLQVSTNSLREPSFPQPAGEHGCSLLLAPFPPVSSTEQAQKSPECSSLATPGTKPSLVLVWFGFSFADFVFFNIFFSLLPLPQVPSHPRQPLPTPRARRCWVPQPPQGPGWVCSGTLRLEGAGYSLHPGSTPALTSWAWCFFSPCIWYWLWQQEEREMEALLVQMLRGADFSFWAHFPMSFKNIP